MKLYKLTDANDQTKGGKTQWGPDVEHLVSGGGWICAYADPLLAIFLDNRFEPPHLWEAEGEVGKRDSGLEIGCTWLKTIRQMPVPEVTTEEHIRFALLCARAVCRYEGIQMWADAWLTGEDRAGALAAAGWICSLAIYAWGYESWAVAIERAAWTLKRPTWTVDVEVAVRATAGGAETTAKAAVLACPGLDLVSIAHEAVKKSRVNAVA